VLLEQRPAQVLTQDRVGAQDLGDRLAGPGREDVGRRGPLDLLELLGQGLQEHVFDRLDEAVLGAEVVQHQRWGDAGCAGDGADRRGGDAPLGEERERTVADPGPGGQVGIAGGHGGHALIVPFPLMLNNWPAY
jgi:hypothetical protein